MATIPITPYSLGVCYYPEQWDSSKWPEDLSAMRDLGLRYVRIGEFAWSRLEPAPGKYDFGWLQEVLDLAAQRSIRCARHSYRDTSEMVGRPDAGHACNRSRWKTENIRLPGSLLFLASRLSRRSGQDRDETRRDLWPTSGHCRLANRQ